MMALVPSTNTNNTRNANTEKIHDEFRTMKKFVAKPEQNNQSATNDLTQMMARTVHNDRTDNGLNMFNKNAGSRVPFNQAHTQDSRLQLPDETTFEQVYQFQQYRDGIPIASAANSNSRQQYNDGMPLISNAASFINRNRQTTPDNSGIQLPLIETNQPRPMLRNPLSKRTSEPLGVLPLKRQRNPINSSSALTSDDTKQSLIHLTEYDTTSPTPHFTFRPTTPNANESPSRLRTYDSQGSATSVQYREPLNKFSSPPQSISNTSTIESPRLRINRVKKSALNRPLSTCDSVRDNKIAYRLLIHDGRTKDQTQEFLQFRQHYSDVWGAIAKLFDVLEKLMCNYFVPIAFIDGEKVAELVQLIGSKRKPTLNELLSTIINRNEVERLIKEPGRRFRDKHGKQRAAIIIQSCWRSYHAREIYKNLKKRRWAANVIASTWLKHSKLVKLRKQLKLMRRRQFDFFHKKQSELRDQWLYISSHRRTIVHIPSLGLSEGIRKNLDNLPLKENYQIGRLCELEDPNIDVIYVSPMPVNDEILQYYNRLISLRALVEQGSEQPTPTTSNNTNERFVIIVPEALNRFPGQNMCLASLLKYSPKALKQIKKLIKDRSAYLVTGISHIDDLYISEYLDISIYGCEPESSYLYSTKSGSKRIFKSSNVPMPYGEYDIYNQKRLLESLAQLIVEHLDVQRWIFKIDDNYDGLGIAYCDIATHLPCYKNVLEEVEKSPNQSVRKQSYTQVLCELSDVLDKHTIYINKKQFNSWQEYLNVFLSEGGIIEAYPPSNSVTSITVCLSIEPDGHYSLVCSGDQLHAESQFSCWGLSFPQTSADSNQLNEYCSSIVEQCRQRNIYGYIDIDFITFIDIKTKQQNLWVIDLCIGYSEHISLSRVMQYITTGKFNPQMHSFTVKMKQLKQRLRNWQNGAPEYTIVEKNRYGILSSKLYHRNLSNLHYSIFFQICRTHGVGFDIREKQGTIFTLYECDHHEHIGMITISDTLKTTLSNFACYLNTIYQEITPVDMQESSNFMLAVNDIENILGITQETNSKA
ncbi:unnamed protein product [Rotaria socialis]|uniref:IQCH-like ATP-grasp domain-containing protein n=1 Tax=Rotaria socialis TaxID=392032 RepID=A0A820NJW7_9BILA|nr:unnamed protein product [Rotaria socialis]CAF4389868.1 unnamed protein product [Rotaria socialis]